MFSYSEKNIKKAINYKNYEILNAYGIERICVGFSDIFLKIIIVKHENIHQLFASIIRNVISYKEIND